MNRFTSQISSSTIENPRQILLQFLDGQVPFSYLESALEKYITIDFSQAPAQRIIKEIKIDQHIKIPVKNAQLCRMLQKYVSGKISELELSNWAAFIFMTPFFVPDGNTEEERWQAGEGCLWEILQKLTTPGVFGGLNFDIANQYLWLLTCNT